MTILGWNELIGTEEAVAGRIDNELYGFISNFQKSVNSLLRLMPYRGTFADPGSETGAVQAYSFTHLVQAPYTCRAAFLLWRRGYYLESLVLCRHLLEALLQTSYFQARPQDLEAHWTSKKRVQFRQMFDLIAPDAYKGFYTLLSDYAHGGITKNIVRFDREAGRIVVGCEFNEELASHVMNVLTILVYGFLHRYYEFIPGPEALPTAISNQRMESLSWLEKSMSQHAEQFPRSRAWHKAIAPLIGWLTP